MAELGEIGGEEDSEKMAKGKTPKICLTIGTIILA